MKVKDFIKVLQEFEDQDADIFIVQHDSSSNCYEQGGTAKEVPFIASDHMEYTDFRGNGHVSKDAAHFNTRKLLIGSMDN